MSDEFTNMPMEVLEAAETVAKWFAEQNIKTWELCGICSRNYADAFKLYKKFVGCVSDMKKSF